MTTVQAGLSRRTINPPPGIYLMGYGNRVQGNTGIHDDVYVTTIVLEVEGALAAFLTVDHTFINAIIVNKIKNQLHESSGIASQLVFVCCSHTHGGPIGYADEHSRPEDRAYMQFLVDTLVESVTEAAAKLQPVRLRGGWDSAHININRRERTPDGHIVIGNNPDGSVDTSVQVVDVVAERGGAALATLVNYACHPVVMGPLNRQVTADWVGAMRREVEKSTNGLCVFFQGAAGNINPRKMLWSADNWEEVEEQGGEVAASVLRARKNASPLGAGLIQTSQSVCWLKLNPARGYNQQIRALMPVNVQTDEQIRSVIRREFPWHTEVEKRNGDLYSPVYIGAARVGDWGLATMATEPFTETGLAIKAASSANMTFVAGYTNGCNSYLPVRSAYDEGGYEVETAPLFYGLPSGFARGGAEEVADALVEILR